MRYIPYTHHIHQISYIHDLPIYVIYTIPFLRMSIDTHMCTYIYINTYMHVYTHTHIHTYKHTHIHTYTHAYMHTCIHTYIHIYIHTPAPALSGKR